MLSETQKEILTEIKARLLHGDIADIAKSVKMSRVYVTRVLTPSTDFYNEEIVNAAVFLIEKRKQDNDKKLKKLQAT